MVAAYFTPVVLVLGLATFLIWMLVGKFMQGRTVEKAGINALMKMITVLVVSCQCAILLCVPMVVIIAVSVAAKKGILIKVCVQSSSFPTALFTSALSSVVTSLQSLFHMLGTQRQSSSTKPAPSQKETSPSLNSIPSLTTPPCWYTISRRPVPTQSPKPSPSTFALSSPPLQPP